MYNNILVNQLKNIGDVIYTLNGIHIIKKNFPRARITLMIMEHVVPLFWGHPLVDEVIGVKYSYKKTSASNMLSLVKLLKNKNFDLSISFDYRLRPLLLCYFAGIKERWGGRVYSSQKQNCWYDFLYTKTYHSEDSFHNIHQTKIFQRLMYGLIENCTFDINYTPSLPAPQKQELLNMQDILDINTKCKIMFCVKGTHYIKSWSAVSFAKCIDGLSSQGYDCYIIGTAQDKEYADQIVDLCYEPPINLCGKTKLNELIALFKCSSLLISVDTGTAHIAAATDTPLIVLFFGTNPLEWMPIGNQVTVLCNAANEYCENRISIDNVFVYDKVTAEIVIDKAMGILLRK